MTSDILSRFKEVQPSLSSSFQSIQADVTSDGRIVFRDGRGCYIMAWLFMLVICAIPVWVAYTQPFVDGILRYALFTLAGIFAVLLILTAHYLIVTPADFEIDPSLRQITIYGGFPISRHKYAVQIDKIRTFVDYNLIADATKNSSFYLVTESGIIYSFGDIMPELTGKILGYICGKLVVSITDQIYGSAWYPPEAFPFRPGTGRKIDIQKLLETATILYDPESGETPDWVKHS
ncbi:MAG: hypothetical protein ACYC0V_11015 [Armatimonadota bacterium]